MLESIAAYYVEAPFTRVAITALGVFGLGLVIQAYRRMKQIEREWLDDHPDFIQ